MRPRECWPALGFAVIVAAMGCGGAEKAPDDSGGLSTSEQQACVAYAEAFCSRIPECAPAGYDVVGGDQPGCVFQKSRECELVLSAADTGISAQWYQGCATAYATALCSLNGPALPRACKPPPGKRAGKEPCNLTSVLT